MISLKHIDWNDPMSEFHEYRPEGILQRVSGVLVHDAVDFTFTLHRQKEGGPCLMRGKLKLISPETGSVLMVNGKTADAEVTTSTDDVEKIRDRILDRAKRLSGKYSAALDLALGRGAGNIPMRPEAVTPVRAAKEYGYRFIRKRYPRSSDKKNKERLNDLRRFYYGLAQIPMQKYSARQMTKYIEDGHFGKEVQKLACQFWEYCLDQRFCVGVNPFPPYAETRKSEKTLQEQALKAAVLSTATQDSLFQLLYEEPTDRDCGVALLSSGFTAEQTIAFRWSDIWLDPLRPDHVRVRLYIPGRAGAQHNYTRPCTPQCAMVLRRRHETRCRANDEKDLSALHIVSGAKTHTIKTGELLKYAADKLLQAGIANDTLYAARRRTLTRADAKALFSSTYRYDLIRRCGLNTEIDGGTFKFLCALSLAGDTTSSNYLSFVSAEAQERLYTTLRILRPEESIPKLPPTKHEDGSVSYHITPSTTAGCAGAIIPILLVQPGEELYIGCVHGADISYQCEKLSPETAAVADGFSIRNEPLPPAA